MSKSFCIRGEGANLTIIVKGRENPDATTVDDRSWLVCGVALTIASRELFTEMSLTSDTLTRFLRDLAAVQRLVEGKASFEALEGGLNVSVTLRPTSGRVEGEFLVSESPELKCSFSFATDQSFLAQTVSELGVLVETFRLSDGE